jgi:hypothetical protein
MRAQVGISSYQHPAEQAIYMPDVLLNYLRVLQEGQGLMAPCLPRQICSAQEIHPGPGQMIMEFIIYIYPLH